MPREPGDTRDGTHRVSARPRPTARTACLLVPDLPLAAELRAHPEWVGRPLVVAASPGPRGEVLSVSPEAGRRGIRRGHGVTHARALCGELRVRVVSRALEQSARHALRDVALSFSPRAALRPPASGAFLCEAAVLLDASGIDALFRSEQGFAASLGARAQQLGLPAHVAVASSQGLAHLAARRLSPAAEGRTCIVPPGEEAAFLAPLPIDLLDPEDALAEPLQRFGLRTLRDLLRLPRRELVTRLGPGVLTLLDQARGRGRETPLPEPDEPILSEALDLEHPVDRLEPLRFVLQGLLSRLLARLDVRHLGCGDLTLRLDLAGGGHDARRVGVAAPTCDLRVLIRLLHQALEARPPEAPVETACVETRGLPPRSDQLDLFRPAGPAPDVLAQVLASLDSLCGDGHVGAPARADSHHPDALALERFCPRPGAGPPTVEGRGEQPGPSEKALQPDGFTAPLALRVLRPPASAQVRRRGEQPVWIRSPVANGAVLRCAGPWRTTGGWWSREGRFAFDHFDVLTEDGTVCRLRFDHVARRWQVDAIYD